MYSIPATRPNTNSITRQTLAVLPINRSKESIVNGSGYSRGACYNCGSKNQHYNKCPLPKPDRSRHHTQVMTKCPVGFPYRRNTLKQWPGINAYWNVPVYHCNCMCHNSRPWRHKNLLKCIVESMHPAERHVSSCETN